MPEFNESLSGGKIGEEEILKKIQIKYPKAFIDGDGKKFSNWDIYIPEINESIEVKNDYKSKHTGNLVIEVECNGKLSALSITNATYWVFITGYEYIWITPLEIYRFLEQHFEYGRVPFVGDGDPYPKKAYLVILNVFKEYIENNLSKIDKTGWIEKIHENEVMYYNNFTKNNEND